MRAPEPKIEEPTIAPQLRGSLDDIAPVKPAAPVKPEVATAPTVAAAALTPTVNEPVAFEPDMTAFALDTGAELAEERLAATETSAEETVIPAKHLEDALLAEFSLDDEVSGVPEAAAPYGERDIARELEASVDDIFADEISSAPKRDLESELETGLAAELSEIERMSAGFDQDAEELDPFVNDGEDAWQLDESVANDPSLDEMSWPAAAEKLAQTEAAHQEALNAAKTQDADINPPPGGYDLDAVAQAMRKADPSLDGGVLPQAVPRVSVEAPVEEESASGGGGLRKGLLAAASIAAIMVVGGAGLFLFDFGGTGGDATPPPIVRADTSPMKETPSPSDQPTTDTAKVFSPEQAAQPVSVERMVNREDADVTPLPPVSNETDTVRSSAFDINPTKKVRTVIVRPDGTIVQNTDSDSGAVTMARPRVVTSTVRNTNPQNTGSTTPAVVIPPSGQWSPLPDETSSTSQQAAVAPAASGSQNGFANALAGASDQSQRNALLGVSVVPQSKPTVVGSSATSGGVRSNTLAPLQSQTPARTSNAPLNLTGNQGAQTSAATPQGIVSTPAPGEGILGEIPAGTYIVQVASVRTVDDARGQIRSYNRRYPELMALVTPVITRADLGDKGVFYRIQVPFDGPTSANTFCGEFKTAGGDCYVRRN